MEWTRFVLRKRIHSVWSNTAGCLFRFSNVDSKLLLIQNHLLLIFKIYIYNSRRSESLKIKSLIQEITKVKNIEEKISLNNEKKTCLIENVWKTQTFWHFIWCSLWVGEGGVGLKRGSRQMRLVFINLGDGKVSGRFFFSFVCKL